MFLNLQEELPSPAAGFIRIKDEVNEEDTEEYEEELPPPAAGFLRLKDEVNEEAKEEYEEELPPPAAGCLRLKDEVNEEATEEYEEELPPLAGVFLGLEDNDNTQEETVSEHEDPLAIRDEDVRVICEEKKESSKFPEMRPAELFTPLTVEVQFRDFLSPNLSEILESQMDLAVDSKPCTSKICDGQQSKHLIMHGGECSSSKTSREELVGDAVGLSACASSTQRPRTGKALAPKKLGSKAQERPAKGKALEQAKNAPAQNTGSRSHICAFCHMIFSQRFRLIEHMRSHPEVTVSYSCQICQKKFPEKKDLDRHVGVHVIGNHCPICRMSFTHRANVLAHVVLHKGIETYRWERKKQTKETKRTKGTENTLSICPTVVTRKNSSVPHTKVHVGEGPYECSSCLKRFTERAHLNSHVLTHTGDKLNQCLLCEKSFLLQKDLEKHTLIHSSTLEKFSSVTVIGVNSSLCQQVKITSGLHQPNVTASDSLK